jgi:HEPN domain-containing protein
VLDKVEYWLDLADYDIDVAKALLLAEKYLYVGFLCHLTIEKALKAAISSTCVNDEIPPKIHNLVRLSDISGLTEKMTDEQSALIEKLNPLNINARYPEYKNRVTASLTGEYCKSLLRKTEGLLCWIKEQL